MGFLKLFLLLLTTISSTYAFGSKALFSYPKGPKVYHPSFQGYGTLSKSLPEAGLVTKEKKGCDGAIDPMSLSRENDLFKGLLRLIANPDQKLRGQTLEKFQELLSSSEHFYNKPYGHQRKVFSGNSTVWSYVSPELKEVSEKYLHLLEATDPATLLKAQLTLQYYNEKTACEEKNECINEQNTISMIKRRHFLLEKLEEEALHALYEILKMDEYELKYKLKSISHPRELMDMGKKIDRLLRSHYRRPQKTREKLRSFMTAHKEELREHYQSNDLHPLARAQTLAQVGQCFESELKPQCEGVESQMMKSKKVTTKVSGLFYHQGFHAYRDYTISQAPYGHHISMSIPLMLEGDITPEEANDILAQWKRTLEEFYNQHQSIRFQFSFQFVSQDEEKVVHLHRCYSASYMSTSCERPSQPNAKNFVLTMDKDVLLEEVGHRMGLFDEYEFYYYIFNPQGARDSFMVAKENYKLYPHHLEQILLPQTSCLNQEKNNYK